MSTCKVNEEQGREAKKALEGLLQEAQERGELAEGPVEPMLLAAVALSHGLTRMKIDGHLDAWGISTDLEQLMRQVTDVLGRGLLREPKSRDED